ncbi:DNA polymerase III subunit delta' [Paenibacillus albiflavus]|uniref:DNA polymerase III subunit delta' n=1 Tax=Paenibacillus albiflavus TaxID=2545760 RepID=A0A4R4E2D5_9BACL|nr:DNA polymerase III subunit delta' [Paenibacillus albiflavus]TCZ70553.1 DNA polymerase III subunit delta' [Paenibacillus albiflavus]
MSFASIRGQEVAKRLLQSSLKANKLSHAYIFHGPVGTSRKQMAIALAKAIYCLNGVEESCGECIECRKVEHGNHPDLHIVEPDGATIKIDQIRELQKEFAYRATASVDGTKIYIIQHADAMTVQAANSLLKFLEEPISKVVAILITENGHALLPTIRSRAQWVTFVPVPRDLMIEQLLQEGFPNHLIYPAVHLTAGPEAARELITTNWFAEIRNVVIQLTKETLTRFPSSFVTVGQKWSKSDLSDHTDTLFDLLILWLKDIVQLSSGNKEKLVYIDQTDWMTSISYSRDSAEWVRILEKAVELRTRLRSNANPQLLLEKMLVVIQGG